MSAVSALTSDQDPESGPDPLDDIIYKIGHDLRASIRAIRDLPGWLHEDLTEQGVVLTEDNTEVLDLMQTHAERLDATLAGLLAYSRVGRLQDQKKLEPARIFERVLAELAPPEDAEFFTRLNPVPINMGEADAAKIFEILLSNALTYGCGETGAKIEVTSCKSGDVWELMVADQGPGIDQGFRDTALRPMERLSGTAETSGAGMGLAILDRITRHYGGDLSIEGRRRKGGCLVRLRLPVLSNQNP